MILVAKKDGIQGPCIDFRKLNAVTILDRFPLSNMSETIQNVGNAKYFPSLDLASGYWQIEITPTSKPYTTFTINFDHYL